MKRVKLPIDWLVFAFGAGSWVGLCFLAYGLYVWRLAASSGSPAAFAEVPRFVWKIGWGGLALAPGLAALTFPFVQWVRIQGGVSDPRLFGRFPLAEDRAQPSDLRGFDRLGDSILPGDPVKRLWLLLFLGLPTTGMAIIRFLDWNPLGTVMIFGMEEGRVEAIIVGIGLFCLLLAALAALGRVRRLQ